jgi:tetratricopeptide (TPR) repeat protein
MDIKRQLNLGNTQLASGDFESALQTYQAVFEQFRFASNSEGMAGVLYQIGMTLVKLGQFQDAIINLKESLELYRFLKKDDKIAMVFHALGIVHVETGEDEIAWHYLEDASSLYQSLGNKNGIASIVFEIANINFKKNDLTEAWENYTKCLELETELNNQEGIAKANYALAMVALRENNLADAKTYLAEASRIFDENSSLDGKIKVKSLEGIIALKSQLYSDAEKLFDECTRLISERYIKEPGKTGVLDKQEEVQVFNYMGSLLLEDSRYNLPDIGITLNLRAYEYFEKAAALSTEIQFNRGNSQALFNLGFILFQRGDIESITASVGKFASALDIAKELKDNELLTRILLMLGMAYRRLNLFDQALVHLQDCIAISRKQGYSGVEARALVERFKIHFQLGRLPDALSALELAQDIASNHAELQGLEGEIYLLKNDFYQSIGDIEKATECLEKSKDIFASRKNARDYIKVLHEFARLNQNQGFLSYAITYLAEIESLYRDQNLLQEASRVKIERAGLMVASGNVDSAVKLLRDEIAFLADAEFTDAEDIGAAANVILFKVLKAKNDFLEADSLFQDLFNYYRKNGKIIELFDIMIGVAYESIEAGDITFLKSAISRLWKMVTARSESLEYQQRLSWFLHVFGLIHQQEGDLETAKKYYDECHAILQKMNFAGESAVLLAQIAELSFIEGRAEALAMFRKAADGLSPVLYGEDLARINARIAILLHAQDDVDGAIEAALVAVKLFEDQFILRQAGVDQGKRFRFYLPEFSIYQFLAGLYLEKYKEENDPVSLERALIAIQFQKIYDQHEKYFKKHLFEMYACKDREEDLDTDESLRQQVHIQYKRLAFLAETLAFQAKLLASPDVQKEFVKQTMEEISTKIDEDKLKLDDLLVQIKKNRSVIMDCADPGSFVPFLGFNIVKNVQKLLVAHPETCVIDYSIFPETSKIAVYLVYQDKVELVLRELTPEFWSLVVDLHDASVNVEESKILFTHQKLTDWLFPKSIEDRIDELDLQYTFVCPCPALSDVRFNILGEENDACFSHPFFHVQNLLLLKRILVQEDTPVSLEESLDFALFYPEGPESASIDEQDGLFELFDSEGEAVRASFYPDLKATYAGFQDANALAPAVIHFAGHVFFPSSLPMKGFFSFNDRSFYLEDFLEFDLQRKNTLLSCSSDDTVLASLEEIFFTWRTLAFSHVPNFIYSYSDFGYTSEFYKRIYGKIIRGDTLGEAYRGSLLELKKVAEISPLARANHVLIASPYWKLK